MNQWIMDKIKESMDFCVKSNNARLETSATFTDEESTELQTHYDAITKILLTVTKREVKKDNMKMVLTFIQKDSWGRPVYENNGKLFVDVDSRPHREPEICTKYNNALDGEPDTPIKVMEKYKNVEIEFSPCRITN